MDDAKLVIEKLIKAGKEFTYSSFAEHDAMGFPASPTANWTAWTTRVAGAIKALFGEGSASYALTQKASQIDLIGYREDVFENAKASFLGALYTAIEVLENDTFGELLNRDRAIAPQDLTNKVFIVHGHDEIAKNELEILLREMGLEPIVLHRQADGGRTIIEKFEDNADVGFAFIILTPDEVAYLASEEQKADTDRNKELRARPNVIWEFGYFVGRLTRRRTCCLYRGDVKLPSDLQGIIYKRFERSIEEVAYSIQKELKVAGYRLAS